MEYATAFDVGDRKRDEGGLNEDSVAVAAVEDGHRDGIDEDDATRGAVAFALADGAGGHAAGDVASYIASTLVVEELVSVAARGARSDPTPFGIDFEDPLPEPATAVSVQSAIDGAIQSAHRDVLAYAERAGEAALTTVVAGVAVDGQLHYGWVGDSRLYVCNAVEETIELVTKDHSVVTELADAGEVDEVEAHVHPRGHEITHAVGGHPAEAGAGANVPVETHTVPLYAEDVVLVTSDGLIDAQTDAPVLHDRYVAAGRSEDVADEIREAVVTDDEIADHVFDADGLQGAADALIELGNDRGGKDNLSTILFRDQSLRETPADPPTRAIDPDERVEDRETVIVPDE
ncbi:MAG: PP2C family serine/threonine-protein phosphatase [Salinirussus sp.]